MNIEPCFFCGNRDVYVKESSTYAISVECYCHASGPTCGTETEAINRWNAIAKTAKSAQDAAAKDETPQIALLTRQANALEEIATVLKFLLKAQDEKVST